MASRCGSRGARRTALGSVRSGRARVAQRFSEPLQQALLQIARAPERWPILVDELRKRPFRGFPHRVIYAVRRDHVLIVAVMHERQRPDYWRERIR